MKKKAVVFVCTLALLASSTNTSFAYSDSTAVDPAAIVVDVLVARPVCLAATIVGSVFFVISLPVAATSKSVHRAAHALVVQPAQATFTRPLGDLDALNDYY